MTDPIQKPDLDDSINVTETHGRIARQVAAAARENKLGENGTQPVSLWLFLALAVVLIIAGGVLGSGGSLFAYGTTFREGYVRKPAPGKKEVGPEPKAALAAYSAKGAKIFTTCGGCHGPDGRGTANAPSLAGSAWVDGPTERLAMVVLNGLHGPTSTGKDFGGAGMPARGGSGPFSPEELAGVLTYVRNNFGNTVGDVVTVDMAKAALETSSKRAKAGQQVDAAELEAEHKKDLPGDKLDPNTLVDPVTLAPAAAK
ncbi:MAG: hypothetical protein CFE26_01825 [Verrucomicrobiales bacterium VVV1]|nr:MAG: hypothetical protein CFE26_01825 [Verrucomicrobiales bacterium VVV1]